MKLLLARYLYLTICPGGDNIILCECGDFIENCTFKEYIKTSKSPSTSTIGHIKCGLIFDFIDGTLPKRYSSKKELKTIAFRFAQKNKLDNEILDIFLLEVDRLKSSGKMADMDILVNAYKKVFTEEGY